MKFRAVPVISMLACLLLSGCSGGGGSDQGSATGTIQVGRTDTATSDYKAVYVSVREVQIHRDEGSWQTISAPNKTSIIVSHTYGEETQSGIFSLTAGTNTVADITFN